jgi:hypothetical protein
MLQVVDVDQVIPIRLEGRSHGGDIQMPANGREDAIDAVIDTLIKDKWIEIEEASDEQNRH